VKLIALALAPGVLSVSALCADTTEEAPGHPRTRNVPVVILTGYPYQAIEEGALEAGAARLLTKPCLSEELEAHARSLVERRARGRDGGASS
jgi:CheY-like chemotaxis protein